VVLMNSERTTNDIVEAVKRKMTPDPYTYTGQLEFLGAKVVQQGALLAELIALIEKANIIPADHMAELVRSYDLEYIAE
jgi:hypothetical protein